jgi:DNA-binding transcriptional ArsR family regulator
MSNYEHEISLEVLFGALSSTARIDIVRTLADGPRCVNAIAEELDLPQSVISQNLRILRLAGIVSNEKHGKHIHYCINPNAIDALRNFLKSLCMGNCHGQNGTCKH